MTLGVGASGVYKEMQSNSAVGAGGVWKTIVQVWVGAGGVWKSVWQAISIFLNPSYIASASDSTGPYSSLAGFRVNSDGNFQRALANGGATGYTTLELWLPSGFSNSDFEFSITGISGTTPSGLTADTWYVCSTTRDFQISLAGLGSLSSSGTMRFRLASGGTIVGTATFSLSCTNSP